MSILDLQDVYWLETHFPVDLLHNGHMPERFTGNTHRTEETALRRAIKALRRRKEKGAYGKGV